MISRFRFIGVLMTVALAALLVMWSVHANTISLTSPGDYQVIQRDSRDKGLVLITGKLAEIDARGPVIETRVTRNISDTDKNGIAGEWLKLKTEISDGEFEANLECAAGGWYRLEVRAVVGGEVKGVATVEHIGIGEVFVVAGQSNSANYGAEKQSAQSGKVVAFTGKKWQLAIDPQPGASGNRGSFMPPLGDALAKQFGVPIGFVPCGIGATSVREWLPKGERFPNPPTIESRVKKTADGQWESNGQAYEMLLQRMKSVGSHGFRAVLWHQGESDANQEKADRTLKGELYQKYLEKIITQSRMDIGWDAPWFVAQVSYHSPVDEASEDIRGAQEAVWKDGVALPGPDSDALKSEWRENNGKGVHFSGRGLQEHAMRWAQKISPWLEQQLK